MVFPIFIPSGGDGGGRRKRHAWVYFLLAALWLIGMFMVIGFLAERAIGVEAPLWKVLGVLTTWTLVTVAGAVALLVATEERG